jgi:lysophospholipase L1-like esterase
VLRRWVIGLVALAELTSGAASVNAAPRQSPCITPAHWAATWGSAIDGVPNTSFWFASPTQPYFTTLPQQTYRFMVRTSTAGDQVRIRLSDPKVSLPVAPVGAPRASTVTFTHVTLGIPGRDGAGLTSPARTLTFHKRTSLTLTEGTEALSDPVSLKVRAGQRLAVSVYVPVPTMPPGHGQTYTTSYATAAGSGDRTSDASAGEFTTKQEPVYWLDEVDVHTTATRTIAAFGDSITDGDQATDPGSGDDFGMDKLISWPSQAVSALQGRVGIVNEGINGDTAKGLLYRVQHDVLSLSGATDVVLEIGTNDITRADGAATVEANLTKLAQQAHAHGLRVIGATLVPRQEFKPDVLEEMTLGHVPGVETMDAARQTLNKWIRTSPIFDGGVLDIAKVVGERGNDNVYQARYDSGDTIHPNTAGYGAIARAFAQLLSRPGCVRS